jgi:hypothetical protein
MKINKKSVIFFFLFSILKSYNCYSQIILDFHPSISEYNDNEKYFIEIKARKKDQISFPFFIDNVIDSTGSEQIGNVRKGIFYVNRPTYLKNGTANAIADYLSEINTAKKGYLPLKIVISKINIFEDLHFFYDRSTVIVVLKFYSMGTLIYSSSEHFSRNLFDGTPSHDNNIKKAVNSCLSSFNQYYEKNLKAKKVI